MRFFASVRGLWCAVLATFAVSVATCLVSASDTDGAPVAGSVDARFRSPRHTLRTFYAAISASREHPSRIGLAVRCLDTTEIEGEIATHELGRRAAQLEAVLRSLDIRSDLLHEASVGPPLVLVEEAGFRVLIARSADGHWRFDAETVARIPAMRQAISKRLAQVEASALNGVPFELHSPRMTVQTYLDAMRRGDLDAAAGCLDLAEVPAPARAVLGPELALKIHEVLDRTGMVLEQDLSPAAAGESCTLVAQKQGRIGLARITSGERAGQWLFDRMTVRTIEPLYDAYAELPLAAEVQLSGRTAARPPIQLSVGLWMRHFLPLWLKHEIPGLRHWRVQVYQCAGILLFALGAWSARKKFVQIVENAVRLVCCRMAEGTRARAVAALPVPMALVAVCELSWASVGFLDLRGPTACLALSILSVCRWFAFAWLGCAVVSVAADMMVAWRSRRVSRAAMSQMLVPLAVLLARIGIVLATSAIVLQMFDVHVGAIVAGLGIGGLACALAAQDTLKNLFGSVSLIADRAFFVGDWIRIGDTEGSVEAVGLRSTRIRSIDDAVLTIPNAELTTIHITNYGARRYRAAISVLYATPPDRLEAFRDGIIQIIESNEHTIKNNYDVRVHDLADSSIDLCITVFFASTDNLTERAAREALILQIVRLAEKLDVQFAFPTRTLHVAPRARRPLALLRDHPSDTNAA